MTAQKPAGYTGQGGSADKVSQRLDILSRSLYRILVILSASFPIGILPVYCKVHYTLSGSACQENRSCPARSAAVFVALPNSRRDFLAK